MTDRKTLSNTLASTITNYQEALEQNPACVERHVNLGACLDQAGDREGAVRCYQRALAARPCLARGL